MGSKQPHPPIMGDQSGPSGSRLPSQLLQNPVKRGRPKNKTLEEMDNAAKKKRLSGALQQEPSASSLQHPPTKFNPNSIPETSHSNTVPPVEQGKEKKKSRGLFKRWRPKPEDACNTVLLHHGMPNYAKIKSFLCFLCKGYLIQPITYTECGHNFCGQCVSKAQKGKGGDKKQYCPQCGKEAPQDKDSVVSDLPLQQKVYKVAPRAYWIDLLRKRNECKTEAQEDTLFSDYIIEQSMKLVADDELVSIVFEYVSPPTPEELKALAKEKVVRGTSPDPQLIEECDQPSTSKVVSEKKDEIVVEAEIVKKKQKEKKTNKSNIPTTFKRYFRTHARNTIGHLKKILDFKLWRPDGFQLVFYGQNVGDVLEEDMTIRDLVYHLGWKRYEPFRISFTLQKDIPEEEAPPMLELEAMPELMAESDQNQAPPFLSTSEAPTSPLPSLTVSLASDLTNTSQPIITPGLMPSQLTQQRRKRKLSSPTKMRNSFDENNSNSNDSPTSTHNGGFDPRIPPSLPSSGDMSMMNRPPQPNQSPKHLPTLMTTVPPHLSMSTVPISHSSPMPLQPPSMMPPPLPPSSSAPSSLPILSHPGSSSRSPIVEQEKSEKSSSSRAPFVSTAQKYDIQVKPLPPPSKPVVSQQSSAPLKVPQIPHPFNGAMQFFQQVMMPSPGVQNVNRKMNGGGNGRQMVPEQPGMRLVHVPMDIPAPMMAYLNAHQTFGRQIAQSMKKNPDEKSANQLRLPTVPAPSNRPGGGDLEILNPVSMQQQLVSISQGSNLKQ